MHGRVSKRMFLKLLVSSAATAGLAAVCFRDNMDGLFSELFANHIDFLTTEEDLAARPGVFSPKIPDVDCIQPGELPVLAGQASQRLAITRCFPQLDYSRQNSAKVQIINIHHEDFPRCTKAMGDRASMHNALFPLNADPGRFIIPWVPLFPKSTPVYKLEKGLGNLASAGAIYIKDEGSGNLALFGNKARKYEFALPFCLQSRANKIVTFGSLGSNHGIYLSLAAACTHLGARFGREDPQVLVNLYPQRYNPSVLKKLRYLLALGARIRFLDSDLETAMHILANRLREHCSPSDNLAYYEPGGSNPLTTLAHVNAVFELYEQIEQGAVPLKEPPDYIFTPLGSGGTAMGLALGCFLLGWNTIVVGTTSQDKSIWKRAAVNGRPCRPFLVQNAARLLSKTIELLRLFDISGPAWRRLEAESVWANNFAYDNVTWKPAYGIASEKTKALMSAMRVLNGVELDSTFSGKSFATLVDYAQKGLLEGKSVLFWNTCQRYDFMANKKVQAVDLNLLPANLKEYLTNVWKVKLGASNEKQ